jgi:hypothetical protein
VGIFWPGALNDDALGYAQLLATTIQREHAKSYGICECSVPVHLHADIWVSLTLHTLRWRLMLTLIAVLL